MGLHSSLKQGDKLTSARSILKRAERIKWLMERELWTEEKRPFGLPKIKVIKLKTSKKEKVKVDAKAGAAAPAAAAPASAKKAPESKKK